MLENMRVVDLTQPLDEGTVMWPGSPTPVAQTVVTISHDGFYNRLVTFVEHTGTHLDAPCHMCEGGDSVDAIDPGRLVRPLAVIDASEAMAGQPDSMLTLEQVHAFEERVGTIPTGAAVFLRTGWEEFNRDAGRYANAPGPLRFPGFGPGSARFLVEERGAVGLGVDTLGIDPGVANDFVVHRQLTLPRGVWHLEGLMNLSQVPPLGAWVVVGVLRLTGGSGSPARVLALVP